MSNQQTYDAFAEAVRLIHKFFPESRSVFSVENGIELYRFIDAMAFCGSKSGFSYNRWRTPPRRDLGLDKKGGFYGEHDHVLDRLLQHAGFSPRGRVVIIPDIYSERGWLNCPETPFVCDHKMAGQRLVEADPKDLFDATSYDSLFVFESGEALAIDRDNRFFWAKSKKNRFKKAAKDSG